MASPIQSLEASYLVHSTEDEDKIGRAVQKALGIAEAGVSEGLVGHFGNRIVRVSYRLTGEAATSAFAGLARRLSSSARRELLRDIEEMMDEHSALYIRLDKQSLVKGELALGGGEPVRVRVKPRLFTLKEGAAGFFKRSLEENV